MSKTALLIVEPDFLSTHVGVRRVILYYWKALEQRGFEVSLATPSDGRLVLGQAISLNTITDRLEDHRSDTPDWHSDRDGPDDFPPARPEKARASTMRWPGVVVATSDFDVSIVTNPWLCKRGLPDAPFTAGIVYDMVPNLLACGALNLGAVIDIYPFARAHDLGYLTYLRHAQTILCISESARDDFTAFYRLSDADRERVQTIIPFVNPAQARIKARPLVAGERPRVLMVNVLDPRKNFAGVKEALSRVAKAGDPFDIDVVGRERMPLATARRFLTAIAATGSVVRWYRSASDASLSRLYADADVLLFPSLYEGLGLPILEAQAQGVPVVSSDTSSCGEINMNSVLSVNPLDYDGLAAATRAVLHGRPDIMSGDALRSHQAEWLSARNPLPENWI